MSFKMVRIGDPECQGDECEGAVSVGAEQHVGRCLWMRLPNFHTQYSNAHHGLHRSGPISEPGSSRHGVSWPAGDAFVFGRPYSRFQGISFAVSDAPHRNDSRELHQAMIPLSFIYYTHPQSPDKIYYLLYYLLTTTAAGVRLCMN